MKTLRMFFDLIGSIVFLLWFLIGLLALGGAALAVNTNVYYVSYTLGTNANNGRGTNSAWNLLPDMPGFTSTYSHTNGDTFVLCGGDLWPSNCFGFQFSHGGAAGAVDSYGVQSNWFIGGSFTRPVFDGGHSARYILYIPTTCRFMAFNSIEMRAINCVNAIGDGLFSYINTDDIFVTNCWFHDWTLTNTVSTDGAHGGIVGQFNGGYGITNIVFDRCEVDNIENTNQWNGVCVRQAGVLNYCSIHDNSSAVLYAQDVNHCQIYRISYPYSGFDGTYHFNGFAMDDGDGDAGGGSNPNGVILYCRNSYLHDIGGGANMAYPGVANYNCYIYNDVFYGVMPTQSAIEVDPSDPGVTTGVRNSCYIYNNTISNYSTSTKAIIVNNYAGLYVSNLFMFNNQVIQDSDLGTNISDADPAYISNLAYESNLIMTPSQAIAQGYTLGNLYAPTLGGSTIGAGTNSALFSGLFTNDIGGVLRTNPWDIGAYQFVSNAPSTNVATWIANPASAQSVVANPAAIQQVIAQ